MVDIETRIFTLLSDINSESIDEIINGILTINKEDIENDEMYKDYEPKPIKLYISSYGGEIYPTFGLIDIIENSNTPIHTYCNGCAMSSGCIIFLAGHKRYMTKNATLMWHQASSYSDGTLQDFVENYEETKWIQEQLDKYVLEKTKLKEDKLKEINEKKQDFYIHADKAVKLGFADKIL